jgi:predicted dehydrogenase
MNVAIVGAGGMGKAWTEALENSALASVVGFVDPLVGTDSLPAWLSQRRGAPMFRSISELAGQPVEAVVVTAPSPAHFDAVRSALGHGFHVLVEKPFTTTMREAEQLVGLAEAGGHTLMVNQNYRFFPGVQKLRALVARQELGAVRAVDGRFRCDWPGKPYQHDMRHPMALEMAIHHFDLIRAVFDAEPETGHVREWNSQRSPYREGGGIEALFEMRSESASFPFLYSGSLLSGAPRTPWGGLWHVEFDGGTLAVEVIDGKYGLFSAQSDGYELISDFAGETMMLAESFQHFVESVQGASQPWPSGRDNLGTLRMALEFICLQPSLPAGDGAAQRVGQ